MCAWLLTRNRLSRGFLSAFIVAYESYTRSPFHSVEQCRDLGMVAEQIFDTVKIKRGYSYQDIVRTKIGFDIFHYDINNQFGFGSPSGKKDKKRFVPVFVKMAVGK